jgi:hypothetical protein
MRKPEPNCPDEHEDEYKVTLLKESWTSEALEASDGYEHENLVDLETCTLNELKRMVRDRGISTASTAAPQPGLTFFKSTTPDECRAFFEQGIHIYYCLFITEKNGETISENDLRQVADELGIPLPQMGGNEKRLEQIQAKMARTLFVCALADKAEEIGYPGPSGADWMQFAPQTPEAANHAADYLIRTLEEVNPGATVANLFQRALAANPGLALDTALNDFAYGVAMQAQGHGVGWADNHQAFEMNFPIYFSASDLILIGRDSLEALPGIDLDALSQEDSIGADCEMSRADRITELPQQTTWGYIDNWEPPIRGL